MTAEPHPDAYNIHDAKTNLSRIIDRVGIDDQELRVDHFALELLLGGARRRRTGESVDRGGLVVALARIDADQWPRQGVCLVRRSGASATVVPRHTRGGRDEHDGCPRQGSE